MYILHEECAPESSISYQYERLYLIFPALVDSEFPSMANGDISNYGLLLFYLEECVPFG